MNVDARDGRHGFSLGQVKQQLRALSAAEPPRRLKAELLRAIPRHIVGQAPPRRLRWWSGATGWAGIAAALVVLCGVVWLRTPAGRPLGPAPDTNNSPGRVLAADHNNVRPPDINALDSNGLN